MGRFRFTVLLTMCSLALAGVLHSTLVDSIPVHLEGRMVDTKGHSRLKRLEGIPRFATFVSTDKQVYRRGETVWWSGHVLDSFTHAPLATHGACTLEIISPKGDIVHQSHGGSVVDGVCAGTWEVQKQQAGGAYTVRVSPGRAMQGFVGGERNITVLSYRVPRLKSQLKFVKDGYGPGDTVEATLESTRAEGGIPIGASVVFVARVDGEEVFTRTQSLNSHGKTRVTFNLPKIMNEGQGSLTATVRDGGVLETSVKTLPIVLQTLDAHFYPAGGDLVAGVRNTVFMEVLTPWQSPIAIEAKLCSGSDDKLTCDDAVTIGTPHEGRGSFVFTPREDVEYFLKVLKPAGIKRPLRLPRPVVSSATIMFPGDEDGKGGVVDGTLPVRAIIGLASAEPTSVIVKLYQKEKELASTVVTTGRGTAGEVEFTPPSGVSGVLRMTVFAPTGEALAERLLFRRPVEELTIQVEPQKESYVPGDNVKLLVRVLDSTGAPVEGAVVSSHVTDDAVVQMKDAREHAPDLPAMVLLENEVALLRDAAVYLSSADNAPFALSHLLGTQGWRRFAFIDPLAFLGNETKRGPRVLGVMNLDDPDVVLLSLTMMDMEMARPEMWDGDVMAMKARGPPVMMGAMMGAMEGAAEGADDMEEDAALLEDEDDEDEMEENMEPNMAKRAFADQRFARPAPQVREYAHTAPHRKPDDVRRTDFTETVMFSAARTTDAAGELVYQFDLSESITSFRVFVNAVSRASSVLYTGGVLGAAQAVVESRRPFYIEPKLPLVVVQGDVVQVPVSVVNGLDTAGSVSTKVVSEGGLVFNDATVDTTVDGSDSVRILFPMTVATTARGEQKVAFASSLDTHRDVVRRTVEVMPRGFPTTLHDGGMVGKDGFPFAIKVPDEIAPGSFNATVAVYPTPVGNLVQALEALIREPHGCFEQTSSTSYPLVMAQQYFKTHSQVDPDLVSRTAEILKRSYTRLVGFESASGGYEWFGASPGHEALTAYGLLQFLDMAKVYPVDQQMMDRTLEWLLSRKNDESGGFDLNPRSLDSFGGAPIHITNAYIVWSLTHHGIGGLDKQIEALVEGCDDNADPYYMGLVAGILYNTGRSAEGKALALRLVTHLQEDGAVVNAHTSITRSRGNSLDIETTSIAVLVWLEEPEFAHHARKAVEWLATRCSGGSFGSTQGTVLALKAIIKYDMEAAARPKEDWSVSILRDDGTLAYTREFTKDHEDNGPVLFDLSDVGASPGTHKFRAELSNGLSMPVSVEVTYNSPLPASSDECRVEVSTSVASTVSEGKTTEFSVHVSNTHEEEGTGMVVAVIGVPGGLEVVPSSLTELVEGGKIAFYETTVNEVVIYWRYLEAKETKTIAFNVVAAIPGVYTAPASRAYEYYVAEHKHWVAGESVNIML